MRFKADLADTLSRKAYVTSPLPPFLSTTFTYIPQAKITCKLILDGNNVPIHLSIQLRDRAMFKRCSGRDLPTRTDLILVPKYPSPLLCNIFPSIASFFLL